MIVNAITRSNVEAFDYRDRLQIIVDGKTEFDVHDGEPEDNSLWRNFDSCYDVVAMMKMAHEAGKRGEIFHVTMSDLEEV